MENAGSVLAEVKEMFAETNRQIAASRAEDDRRRAEERAEFDRRRAEERAEANAGFDRQMAESRAEADRQMAVIRTAVAEASRAAADASRAADEASRAAAEATSAAAKNSELLTKLGIGLEGAKSELKGISTSNGMLAEAFFFEALKEKLTFAGIHFDYAKNDIGRACKKRGCPQVEDQYDIMLINEEALAIIEVKYRAREEDVGVLANRKMEHFRILFPEYKDYRVYLGLGAMTFEKGVLDAAKGRGIRILRQVGEIVEEDAAWEARAY